MKYAKKLFPKTCDALDYLKQKVSVIMDRPLGSKHPKHGFIYPVNYGYIPDTISGDGEELDAYVLGIQIPKEKFTGKCIAIIHRTDDNDDKLIVVPEGVNFSDQEIEEAVQFQEKWFHHTIIRKKQPVCYLICGFLGAGKTTYSQKLSEKTSAIHLNPDEWCMKLFTKEERKIGNPVFQKQSIIFGKKQMNTGKKISPLFLIWDFGQSKVVTRPVKKPSNLALHPLSIMYMLQRTY